MQLTTVDPTFVRVRKGVYAIRALMGDLPYEAVGCMKRPVANATPAGNADRKANGVEGDSPPCPDALPSNAQQEATSLPKVPPSTEMQCCVGFSASFDATIRP